MLLAHNILLSCSLSIAVKREIKSVGEELIKRSLDKLENKYDDEIPCVHNVQLYDSHLHHSMGGVCFVVAAAVSPAGDVVDGSKQFRRCHSNEVSQVSLCPLGLEYMKYFLTEHHVKVNDLPN